MKGSAALLAASAVLVLMVAPGLSAQPGEPPQPSWNWTTSLDTVVAAGDTRYLMEELAPYWVSSELIFPLNTVLARLSFQGERTGGSLDWGLEVTVATNLVSPFGKMEDYDWWMDPDVPKIPFSYTESDAGMRWLVASLAWKPLLAGGAWGRLDAVLGYRLQYVYQEIDGYNGWVYDDITTPPDNDPEPPNTPDGQPELWYQSGTGIVLTYWVLWNIPTAGLSVSLQPGPSVSVRLEAGAALPYVADEDDHVLRYKLSTARGLGFGGYAGLAARFSWGAKESRVRTFLSLAVEGMFLKANTWQTQTYYTGATEAPPGTSSSGIDHQISTRQLAFALAAGIAY